MAKKNTNTVTINGTEHNYDDLNDTQKIFLSDVVDLERKVGAAQAHLRQVQIGHQACLSMLTQSLAVPSEDLEAAE
ncbi:hypothetical protein OAU55_00175 [Candidatus Pelagibacter sp.]|jgi:hypothetical protein|nr:hypothetical protein [Candidatus Pelagibacter sp.]|tara:strand:- start:304 stop:531 length:228 start_codon:yes stop_codon:yes gene_type:complete